MTADAHLQALLRCRQWELDAAAARLQLLQQQLQAGRDQAQRVALRRQDLLSAASHPGGVVAIDAHQRRLLQLMALNGEAERLQVQAGQTEAKLGQANDECTRRQMQLQGLREHHRRLQAAARMDLLRREARDTDAAHLVRCATLAVAGGWS